MRRRIVSVLLAACLTAGLAVGSWPAAGLGVKAAVNPNTAVEEGLTIRESEINQLLTGDLQLPTTIEGLDGATIAYSVEAKDAKYASIEGNTLKITRPAAGEDDYQFTLTATITPPAGVEVTSDDGKLVKKFPLTIRAGLTEDSYAGYVYVCFSVPKGKDYDVQQIHFFLSEDGLNWTALNGCKPIFETGTDYEANIERCASNSVNYNVVDGTDIAQTTSGDASVLFPFEGRDQGVRDPYLIRGCKPDGSDSNKVWLLATDLNTHSDQYNGNKANNALGSWGMTSQVGVGSTNLFVWETEDWVHWERRCIDVGGEIDAAMAWAPEAIYNPEKDNYLVYWSARVDADGATRNRLYCNETKDFKTFGPTKLYEAEPYYKNYGNKGQGNNSGYGNIDTSQLWVAGKDKDNKDTPFGTLYRVVKDETNNHIELMSSNTVLDPAKDYDATNPVGIKPFTLDNVTYSSKDDLSKITGDTNEIKRAQIVHNWFADQSVGNHFQKINQKNIEKLTGAYEGATMFKFIDRDEWCVMIDFYGDMQVRYEPYVTSDLSKPNSVQKMPEGTYGRTGGDVGTHGGMIPITVEEYNTMIDTYNADPSIDNFHKIDYISVDTREYDAKMEELRKAATSSAYSDNVKAQMKKMLEKKLKGNETIADLDTLIDRADRLIDSKLKTVPELKAGAVTIVSEPTLTICTKATDGLKKTATVKAEADLDSETSKITFKSSAPKTASVNPKTGVVTAKKKGNVTITATAPGGAKATCKVTVKGIPSKITLNKKSITLKKKKTFQIKVTIPKGTVCSKFTYKSNKSKIAAVSKTGKITAKKKGTAKVTVTAGNNKKAKATITVKVK
ncbi:MAG: hypothetical protein HFI71_02210 [Lachnospiraceae bacterium]|nr:hypothetical protein [Lachnospiraceae bacterium]